jgi:hypothetical protein
LYRSCGKPPIAVGQLYHRVQSPIPSSPFCLTAPALTSAVESIILGSSNPMEMHNDQVQTFLGGAARCSNNHNASNGSRAPCRVTAFCPKRLRRRAGSWLRSNSSRGRVCHAAMAEAPLRVRYELLGLLKVAQVSVRRHAAAERRTGRTAIGLPKKIT